MNQSGIYKIVSSIDGKEYIGSAVNIYQRWAHHKHSLINNRHTNSKLQRYVNKYGFACLEFVVIELCKKSVLVEVEQKYLDARSPYFNICKKAGNSLGYRHTPETRASFSAMRKAQINNGMRGKKHKASTKKLIGEKARARGPNFAFMEASKKANLGRKHTETEIRKRAVSCAKITPRQCAEIKSALACGARQVDLAKKYGVSQRVICRINIGDGIYGDETYYNAAVKRFDEATKQQAMAI